MELLKQPLCRPLSSYEQVITLWAATHKLMADIPVREIKAFQMEMLEYIDKKYPEIRDEIQEKKVLSDQLGEKILKAAEEFKNRNR